MTDTHTSDVIISGGGLVGQTLALALAAHGLSSSIIDPADPAKVIAPGFDGRASAIASASYKMLDAIGVAGRLAGKGCDIRKIWVSDGLKPGELDFTAADDDGPLGTMYENRDLRIALRDAVAESDEIALHMPARAIATTRGAHGVEVSLDDGTRLAAPLLIAAEGRRSPTRDAAGFTMANWAYDHSAIIGGIAHELPHDSVAYEIFYPAGPFALLPLPDLEDGRHRSAFVWSVARADAPGLLKLGTRGFTRELEKRMGGLLGDVTMIAPRMAYPLGFHHSAKITGERLALVGDAAHGIHPIAGQGLNLGLRDVAALTEVLVDGARLGLDLGDAQLMDRYERWRGLDSLSVAVATDVLTRLFGIRGKAASAVRRFGLGAVQATPPLKSLFMSEARGESGDLPKLLTGMTV